MFSIICLKNSLNPATKKSQLTDHEITSHFEDADVRDRSQKLGGG
jgi:hypothetical protein